MDSRKDYWDSRARLGLEAGSPDTTLKMLELNEIAIWVPANSRVLDVGCGNGILAKRLAEELNCEVVGLDYSEQMILAAQEDSLKIRGSITYRIADVRVFEFEAENFDVVVTERMLINLDSADEQAQVLGKILHVPNLRRVILCESSRDGLEALNDLRVLNGLQTITPPWHNTYLESHVVSDVAHSAGFHVTEIDFSSCYYFSTRILNALLGAMNGVEPSVRDEIPQLPVSSFQNSLVLDSQGRSVGQTRLWILDRV